MNHCVCCMRILDLSDAIFLAVKGSFWSVKLTKELEFKQRLALSFWRSRISLLFNQETFGKLNKEGAFSFHVNYNLSERLSIS